MIKAFDLKAKIGLLLACWLVATGFFLPIATAQDAASSPVDIPLPVAAPTLESAVDSQAPVMSQPADIFAAATDAMGAVVLYDAPSAKDETDGPVGVSCEPGSGAIFSVGTTVVTCWASDSAGNSAPISFSVTVTDQSPPVISVPADNVLDSPDPAGMVVNFTVPGAWDNVDAYVVVSCDWGLGSFFPVGTTIVNCWASDSAGNVAAPIAFSVVINPPPPTPIPTTATEPTAVPTLAPATVEPTHPPTQQPAATTIATAKATSTPAATSTAVPTSTPRPTSTPGRTPTPAVSPTPQVEVTATPFPTPVPKMLDLPWPPPVQMMIDPPGGPLNGIDAIWGYQEFPISQEFGHTEFSISHSRWYSYGTSYGLDGFEHSGLDIAIPAGTWLYSPVNGTVRIAGDTPYFTYYGNGDPYVGQLLIVTDSGDEVVLGHMGRIALNVGDRVSVGDFVGLSGGFNGDHLHLEVREIQAGGWLRAVDPRTSFIVDMLKDSNAATPEAESTP